MSDRYILALDEGTSSVRAIIFDHLGRIRGVSQQEFTQIFPEPGFVEFRERAVVAGRKQQRPPPSEQPRWAAGFRPGFRAGRGQQCGVRTAPPQRALSIALSKKIIRLAARAKKKEEM